MLVTSLCIKWSHVERRVTAPVSHRWPCAADGSTRSRYLLIVTKWLSTLHVSIVAIHHITYRFTHLKNLLTIRERLPSRIWKNRVNLAIASRLKKKEKRNEANNSGVLKNGASGWRGILMEKAAARWRPIVGEVGALTAGVWLRAFHTGYISLLCLTQFW